MDGSARTDTLSLVAMTWATTAPIWLFISVTPHWLEAVLSDLNGDSAVLNLGVVTAPAPSGHRGGGRGECRRTGSWRRRGRPRTAAAWRRSGTRAAGACGRRRW